MRLLLALISLLIAPAICDTPPGKDAILLSNVKTLTLRANRETSARRVTPIPQLSCVGPSKKICKLYQPEVMRCTNQGYDYDVEDVQWTCKTDLPAELKLGATDVICEGYRNADDKWVLKGSCAVEYRMLLTEIGEKRYGRSYGEEFDWIVLGWTAIVELLAIDEVVVVVVDQADIQAPRPRTAPMIPQNQALSKRDGSQAFGLGQQVVQLQVMAWGDLAWGNLAEDAQHQAGPLTMTMTQAREARARARRNFRLPLPVLDLVRPDADDILSIYPSEQETFSTRTELAMDTCSGE
ncbi:unnamed protein product [Penicillium bialowiezense]